MSDLVRTNEGSALEVLREHAAWLRKAGEFMTQKAEVIEQAIDVVSKQPIAVASISPERVIDPCTGCMGSGNWVVGMPCMRCLRKGWQSREDVMRNANYDATRRNR